MGSLTDIQLWSSCMQQFADYWYSPCTTVDSWNKPGQVLDWCQLFFMEIYIPGIRQYLSNLKRSFNFEIKSYVVQMDIL